MSSTTCCSTGSPSSRQRQVAASCHQQHAAPLAPPPQGNVSLQQAVIYNMLLYWLPLLKAASGCSKLSSTTCCSTGCPSSRQRQVAASCHLQHAAPLAAPPQGSVRLQQAVIYNMLLHLLPLLKAASGCSKLSSTTCCSTGCPSSRHRQVAASCHLQHAAPLAAPPQGIVRLQQAVIYNMLLHWLPLLKASSGCSKLSSTTCCSTGCPSSRHSVVTNSIPHVHQ
ncbi:hypothetical protein ACOMHN_039748 [Nucella lapillus]